MRGECLARGTDVHPDVEFKAYTGMEHTGKAGESRFFQAYGFVAREGGEETQKQPLLPPQQTRQPRQQQQPGRGGGGQHTRLATVLIEAC
jgi:hypothetical protein